MATLLEALSVIMRWIDAIWKFLEPILALPDSKSRLLALGFLLSCVLLLWRSIKRKPIAQPPITPVLRAIGPAPTLFAVCDYLKELAVQHAGLLQLPVQLIVEVTSIAQDLKDGNLRLYFFGHQKAGKSSLVNELVGESISPVFPGKMTACIVRIKHGLKPRILVRWESGVDQEISAASLKKKMANWSDATETERPREILIETSRELLGTKNTELVDSPGTGSAWNTLIARSLEDEMVANAVKSAAVAIVVYRYDANDMEAHENLLRQLGSSQVPTVAVCNLDPNWANEYRANRNDINKTIAEAESRLRHFTKANCYRVAIKRSTEVLGLLGQADCQTVDELRTELKKLLGERGVLVRRQAVNRCQAITEEISQRAEFKIQLHGQAFDRLEEKKEEILAASIRVRSLLNVGYERGYGGTIVGASVGGLLGAAGLASAAVLTAATGGLFLGFLATGTAIGFVVDKNRQWNFREQLAKAWGDLQRIALNSEVIGREISRKISAKAESLAEEQCAAIVGEIEESIQEQLQRIPEYRSYSASKNLERLLPEFRMILSQFI